MNGPYSNDKIARGQAKSPDQTCFETQLERVIVHLVQDCADEQPDKINEVG